MTGKAGTASAVPDPRPDHFEIIRPDFFHAFTFRDEGRLLLTVGINPIIRDREQYSPYREVMQLLDSVQHNVYWPEEAVRDDNMIGNEAILITYELHDDVSTGAG